MMLTVLDIDSQTTMALLPLVVVIAEWQAGCYENKNQYDVKAFDKFTKEDGKILCLESLHYFQSQKKDQGPLATPFFINGVVKTYVVTCLLGSCHQLQPGLAFGIPIIVAIVAYTYILPLTLDLVYIKSELTFCQLEIYRTLLDITLPLLIVAFTLV